LKINNTNELVKQINKILLKYSDDNSISLILLKKNVIIGKSELDISMDIIKLVNAAIKEFKIK
jgi:Skp family chaperone for outer membrane proteins